MNETNGERSLQAACALKVHPYGGMWGAKPTRESIMQLVVDLRHLCYGLKLDFKELVDESFEIFDRQAQFEDQLLANEVQIIETENGRNMVKGLGGSDLDIIFALDGNMPSDMNAPVVVKTVSKKGWIVGQKDFDTLSDYIGELQREEDAKKDFEVLDDVRWIRRIIRNEDKAQVSTN